MLDTLQSITVNEKRTQWDGPKDAVMVASQ